MTADRPTAAEAPTEEQRERVARALYEAGADASRIFSWDSPALDDSGIRAKYLRLADAALAEMTPVGDPAAAVKRVEALADELDADARRMKADAGSFISAGMAGAYAGAASRLRAALRGTS